VASFRSGVAALVLWLLVPAARRRWSPRVVGVAAAYAATLILFVVANKLTTAANTIFLQSTAPLYVLLLAPWLLREPIRRLDLLHMAALALGMGLFFVGVETPQHTAPDPLGGNVLAAVAGVTWALTILGLRFLSREGEGEPTPDRPAGGEGAAAAFAGNLLACVAVLPWALPVVQSRPVDWAVLAYLGIFQVGVAYVLLTRAMRWVGAFEASLLLMLEPVLNPVWAWLVHGERPGAWSLAGGLVILGATAVKTWMDGRRREGARPG
jgi:drug/metabolite transporter (DMT)-like permease